MSVLLLVVCLAIALCCPPPRDYVSLGSSGTHHYKFKPESVSHDDAEESCRVREQEREQEHLGRLRSKTCGETMIEVKDSC